MILIHDGYMIDPKSGREGNYDILIDGDKIVKIAEKIEPRGKVTRINAEGDRRRRMLRDAWFC